MEHFLFAVQAVFPTACILFCGYGLRRRGVFSEEFLKQGDRLCFSFLFPILVFWNLYQGREYIISYERYGKVILFAYGMIFFSALAGMALVPKVIPERGRVPVVIQSACRGNFMLYGLPFSELLGGKECLVMATAMTAATLPILNAMAIFQFSYYTGRGKQRWGVVLGRIFRNPIIWGVLLGLLFQRVGIYLPASVETVLSDLAKKATPLAFLILGGRFHFRSAGRNRRMLGGILFCKLLLLPMVFLPFCVFILKMDRVELVLAFIFTAAPSAITTYQLAGQYDADGELAGDVVVYSLLFSILTIFVLIFLLKNLGWV